MEKKKLYGIIAACLIVACAVVLSLVLKKDAPQGPGQQLPTGEETVQPPTLEKEGHIPDVPAGAVVTPPVSEAPAAPDATERFRVYTLVVSKEGYAPNQIVVNKGDVVQLNLTASGGSYDFSMPYTGLSQSVGPGETKQVSFGATSEGTFEFRCNTACPPGKVIRGQLIVLP